MQIVSGPICYERVHYQAPDSKDLDQLMIGFLDWFNNRFSDDPSSTPDSQTQFWQRHKETELSPRQVTALNKIFKAGREGFPNGISAQKYAALAKCAKATATRDLGDLVSKDCLSIEGIGRGIRYFIKLGTLQRSI